MASEWNLALRSHFLAYCRGCTQSENSHILSMLPYFSFASPKRKVTKVKASFGQRLRRPKHSSTLLSHSICHRYGAEILPILAAIELFNCINFNTGLNYRIHFYDSLKAPS